MNPNRKKNQIRRTYESLKEQPKTTKMIQVDTGIPRENITRYIAYLEDHNLVATLYKKPCKITGHAAKYYSTEKKYLSPKTQSELFPTGNPKHAGAYSQ